MGKVLRRFEVAEESMLPSLRPGDRLLCVRLRRPPRRASVVVFEHPERPGFWLVKRVVALPGETVEIDGVVRIDGVVFPGPWGAEGTPGAGRWEVGAGEMFVLSDARLRTRADSRTFGPVPIAGAYRPLLRYRRGPT